MNEFMPYPYVVDQDYGEWMELYNAGTCSVNLRNWKVVSYGQEFTINPTGTDPVWIAPGGYFLLAVSSNTTANVPIVDFVIPTTFYFTVTDVNFLYDTNGVERDRTDYSVGLGAIPGRSVSLRAPDADNSLRASWCISNGNQFGASWNGRRDYGTPRGPNDCAV